jgi:hypothetical protein
MTRDSRLSFAELAGSCSGSDPLYSTDAGMVGNRLGPDEALRFAKGEMVVSSTGVRARLIRPLEDLAPNLSICDDSTVVRGTRDA